MDAMWRRLAGLVVVSLVGVVTSPIAGPERAAAAPGDGLVSILVMGDSYSAGNGAGGYYGPTSIKFPGYVTGCWRSANNYARQFQRIIERPPFNQHAFVHNEACNGAVTSDFWLPRDGRTQQLAAVNDGYDLIFLTIGGNDLGFGEIVKKCLIGLTRDGVDCGNLLTNAENKLRDGSVESDITTVLRGIRRKAHADAKIVLLGYPFLESNTSYQVPTESGCMTSRSPATQSSSGSLTPSMPGHRAIRSSSSTPSRRSPATSCRTGPRTPTGGSSTRGRMPALRGTTGGTTRI